MLTDWVGNPGRPGYSDSSWPPSKAPLPPGYRAGPLLKWGFYDVLSDKVSQRISLWLAPRQKGKGLGKEVLIFTTCLTGKKVEPKVREQEKIGEKLHFWGLCFGVSFSEPQPSPRQCSSMWSGMGTFFERQKKEEAGICWGWNERAAWRTGMETWRTPLWNFWEREGAFKQLRREQTPSHSKASGGTWWPFKDTGACGCNWKALKTNRAHRTHPAGRCLHRVAQCSGPPPLCIPETSPSIPSNTALPSILGYVPVFSILFSSHSTLKIENTNFCLD